MAEPTNGRDHSDGTSTSWIKSKNPGYKARHLHEGTQEWAMRNAVLVLLLAVTSVPLAGADPMKLTVSGPVTFIDDALAQHHLGFPVFGDNFLLSADFDATPSDTFPNGGTFTLDRGQLRFTVDSGGEFISAFTGGAVVVNGPPNAVDEVQLLMDPVPFASQLFEFTLELQAPASWLNGVALSPSVFAMHPPFTTATLSAQSFVSGEDDGEFLRATVQTVTASPAPVPEPASAFLIGTGLVALAARRWRRYQPEGASR